MSKPILKSKNFELAVYKGVGTNDTPYTRLEVESKGTAHKHVVSIDLDSKWEDFVGKPVQYKYYNVRVSHGMRMRIDTLDAKAEDMADVNKYLLGNDAKAVVFVVDNATDPAILVAPEDKWAKVNIGKFKDKNVKSRTQMELLRAFCYLCGGIGSEYNNPLTGFIGNPTQLDDSPIAELPIDVINRCSPYLKQLGVIPYIESTYRKACREGWAPAPTNDVQKAIWEDINATKERGPANALPIPSPKKK